MHFPPAFTADSQSPPNQMHQSQWHTRAATLDSDGSLPEETLRECVHEVGAGTDADTLERLEALTEHSTALAILIATRRPGTGPAIPVFPGVRRLNSASDDECLRLAAVAVGLGRRSVDVAIRQARERGERPSGLPHDPPHWLLADAATDVDAARLLVLNAASGESTGAAAVLIAAAAAAVRAADVAQRLNDASDAQTQASTIDLLARQARGLLSVAGGEDELRRRAADALLA
jgi:hypothetical protein